jgi:hypothetical protein
VEKIYETLNKGGATLHILREDASLSVIIQPMLLPVFDEADFYLDENDEYPIDPDSMYFDSTYIDSEP